MVFQLSSSVRTHGKMAGSRNGDVGTREARTIRRSRSCRRRAPISFSRSMTRSLMMLAAARQLWLRGRGVHHPHLAAGSVDGGHRARPELVAAELIVHDLAGFLDLGEDITLAAAGVAQGGDGQAREKGGPQTVAHAVG